MSEVRSTAWSQWIEIGNLPNLQVIHSQDETSELGPTSLIRRVGPDHQMRHKLHGPFPNARHPSLDILAMVSRLRFRVLVGKSL